MLERALALGLACLLLLASAQAEEILIKVPPPLCSWGSDLITLYRRVSTCSRPHLRRRAARW